AGHSQRVHDRRRLAAGAAPAHADHGAGLGDPGGRHCAGAVFAADDAAPEAFAAAALGLAALGRAQDHAPDGADFAGFVGGADQLVVRYGVGLAAGGRFADLAGAVGA